MNREFDNKLKMSYDTFIKEKENEEKSKKMKLIRYKEELDKQINEKSERLKKPLMDETERLINKTNLS
jgi:predicted nuclease with TOPRIM domain